MEKLSQSFLRFKYLFFIIILNVTFIALFLREVNSPIFILGNIKIILFNLLLFAFAILYGHIKNYRFNQIIKLNKFSLFDKFSIILIPTLLSILFWSLFPTIIDRSISINILGNLYKENRYLSISEINQGLLDTYIKDDYQTKKRLSEQIYLGNIIENNKNYALTPKGKIYTKIYRLITSYFNLEDVLSLGNSSI